MFRQNYTTFFNDMIHRKETVIILNYIDDIPPIFEQTVCIVWMSDILLTLCMFSFQDVLQPV